MKNKTYYFIRSSFLVDVLGLIFITLKLCGKIDWSWLWVLAPFWGQIAVAIVFWLIMFVITGISDASMKSYEKFYEKSFKKSTENYGPKMYWDAASGKMYDSNGVVGTENKES